MNAQFLAKVAKEICTMNYNIDSKMSVFMISFILKKGFISSNVGLNCLLLVPKYERTIFGQSSERNMHYEL